MTIGRRQFLKAAGAAGILGLLGSSYRIFAPGELEAFTEHKTGASSASRRMSLVVDMKGFPDEASYNKCVEACNNTHNIPHIEDEKHEIKWIWPEKYENAFPDSSDGHLPEQIEKMKFLVLCNHCDKPPCVRVCPTKATFKRPDGIVAMDYHRCIGCRFCMAACPYGARSFNWSDPRPFIKKINPLYPTRTKGVVEKCNFCADRLSRGERPACVEASNGALIFGDLNDMDSDVRKTLRAKYAITRKPDRGTLPGVYYIIGGSSND
ncbi:MAG: 4Fe-4S dicluster domain-containing protein [Candidatus Magnetominusculus sp. LBB02]|nr:4Fe-4S dicluster domain-containing protein [Candidatus Magnetominusculus sp. LBB02]